MTKISIVIPTYEYNGYGVECLEYSFSKMKTQTFKSFDIVISDDSKDDEIFNLCLKWNNDLDIKYFRHRENVGNPAANTNNAMRNATGQWLKILCQDDYLLYDNSLEIINGLLDDKYNWIATGYIHTYDRQNYFSYHAPSLNPDLCVINTIGTPSCVTFRNISPLMEMDTELSYCYDCEYYHRFSKVYGDPKLSNDVTIANYLWDESISANVSNKLIEKESMYILRKHGYPV